MYSCEICKYFTINNSNYHKHLKTVKHIQKWKNIKILKIQSQKKITKIFRAFQNRQKITQNYQKNHQNIPEHSRRVFRQTEKRRCMERSKRGLIRMCVNFVKNNIRQSLIKQTPKKCSDAIEESKKMQNEYLENQFG